MREFGIKFQRGLQRGLRPFANSRPGAENMIECFNVQPTETGLRSKDELTEFGIKFAFYEYMCARDQTGIVWCFVISRVNEIIIYEGFPDEINGLVPSDLTPSPIPYWYFVPTIDRPSQRVYVYPEVRSGELIASKSQPPIGTGVTLDTQFIMFSVTGFRSMICPILSDLDFEVREF